MTHPMELQPKTPVGVRGTVHTPIAVRTLELSQPLQPLESVESFARVRIFGLWQGVAVCQFDLENHFAPLSIAQLEAAVASQVWEKPTPHPPLSPEISVSIVIATCDRPTDLSRCLTHLLLQHTSRQFDLWVVDNRPHSGLTYPVIEQIRKTHASSDFPTLHYLAEPRRGGSFARNAGFAACSGEMVVIVDDDVTVPPDWLERLLAPLSRPEVAMVTGNLLPMSLEARSQQIFEGYCNGGLSRGFVPFEVETRWFRDRRLAVPTWELGATANLAFRRSILDDSRVGNLDPVLSPGLPTGGGEDLYWFYRILAAGYRIVYEPQGWAWHQHRQSMRDLKTQIYSYGKGNIGYHLTTLTRHRDWRVLPTLLIFLPIYFVKRCLSWLQGTRDYPLHLTFLEIAGMLAGPWSWWRSQQVVRQILRHSTAKLQQHR